MSCVNTNSKEFKSLLDKVDVSSATLELIIHKIQNTENTDRFPSVSEINEIDDSSSVDVFTITPL